MERSEKLEAAFQSKLEYKCREDEGYFKARKQKNDYNLSGMVEKIVMI